MIGRMLSLVDQAYDTFVSEKQAVLPDQRLLTGEDKKQWREEGWGSAAKNEGGAPRQFNWGATVDEGVVAVVHRMQMIRWSRWG